MDNLYILNRQEEVVSILSGSASNTAYHFFDGLLTKELNTAYSLSFTVDLAELGADAEHITEENFVVCADGEAFRLFIIREIIDTHETAFTREIFCECASSELYYEVFTGGFSGKLEIATALDTLLEGTRWSAGEIEDSYVRELSEEYTGKTVQEGVFNLVGEFAVEVEFSVDFSGNTIIGRYINIKKAFGRTLGKRFEYSKDLTSIKRTVNSSNVRTAIIPYGIVKNETTTETYTTEDATEDTTDSPTVSTEEETITIGDVEWVTPDKPLNKPLGQIYLEDPEATKLWGFKGENGQPRPRWICVTFENVTGAEHLINLAYTQLKRFTEPSISYEAEAQDLYALTGDTAYSHEAITIGDLVNVVDKSFSPPLELSTRVVRIEKNLNNESESVITFGELVRSFVDTDLQAQINALSQKVDSVSSPDLSGIKDRLEGLESSVGDGVWETVKEINDLLFSESLGYHYMEEANGIWVYDRPKDSRPTKAVVLKGGQIGLAKWDAQLSKWDVGTFIDGTSVNANFINVGTLKADRIETGKFTAEYLAPALKEEIDGKVSVGTVETMIEQSASDIELSVSSKFYSKEQIDESLASIEITDERITNTVGESFVKKDEYTETTLEIQEKVSMLEQSSENITMSFTELLKEYTTNEEFGDFVNEFKTNITFDANGITLGRTDSQFTTHISNEKISFMQSGEEVAYISNNKLFITNGEIVEELILGGYKIEPRASGNLSFMWNN